MVKKVKIFGRVQGVGFRYFTVQNANRLNLHGWVQNMADGTVESLIAGEPGSVAEMIEKLKTGPVSARVDRVEYLNSDQEPVPDTFRVKR
jgi:acylphosphatase